MDGIEKGGNPQNCCVKILRSFKGSVDLAHNVEDLTSAEFVFKPYPKAENLPYYSRRKNLDFYACFLSRILPSTARMNSISLSLIVGSF